MEGRGRQGRQYYLSRKRKIVLLVLIFSFTWFILISGTILYQFRVSYQKKVRARLEEVVKKHAQNIDSVLDDGNLRLGEKWRILLRETGSRIPIERASPPAWIDGDSTRERASEDTGG